MSTIILRQKLHSYLEIADDKKVKAIYAIMENDIEQSALEYTTELKSELDNRYTNFKNGKAKIITAEESRKKIQRILKVANKK
jgi:hypothetical protein